MSVSLFSNSWRLSTTFYRKTSEVKKFSWTICDLQYNFHCDIFRHHWKITIVKFWIKTDTCQATDSAVWCTPWSLTPRSDAHCESDSTVWCTPWSFLKIWISRRNWNRIRKYFSLFIRGPDGFKSGKKWRSKISWHTPFKLTLSKIFFVNVYETKL